MTIRRLSFSVPGTDKGTRIDKWLAMVTGEITRSRLRSLLESGEVSVDNNTVCDPAYRVKSGQVVKLCIPEASPASPIPQKIPLNIIFEDADIIVIDKPPGMVVHPAPGNRDNTLVNALLSHCGNSLAGIGGVRRPGIVHRLDKDTSGLLVAAKTEVAHLELSKQFAARKVRRTYRALIWGIPLQSNGEIRGNIGRSPNNRKKMTVLKSGGKTAITKYRVQESYDTSCSLVQCQLKTGRTHQIRVHLAYIGHPVIGDPLYKGRQRALKNQLPDLAREFLTAFTRQALHAESLGFSHPITGQLLNYRCPLPSDFKQLLARLRK